ncbi:hypothetical protein ACFLRM_07090, partial [Acidobacteriota bacterium]
IEIELEMPPKGTYYAVLLFRDIDGQPTTLLSAEINVLPNRFSTWIDRVSGILLGALIAILVFVIQDNVRRVSNKNVERNKLRHRISGELDKLDEWQGERDKMPKLPNWMFDTSDQFWSVYIQTDPFRNIISELEEIRRSAYIEKIDKQELKTKIGALKDKLKDE